MRWHSGRRSSNVEDLRGARPVRGRRRLALGGGASLLILGLALLLSSDARRALLGGLQRGSVSQRRSAPSERYSSEERRRPRPRPRNDEQADFVSVVLADTEDTWGTLFREAGKVYREPKLVLFRDAVRSACGLGRAAVGPFYCPADRKAYLDLSFFDTLRRRFKAPGDFAQAYVIAHEIGHHVQNLLGVSGKVHRARRRLTKEDAAALTVRLELQADCYAGIWAHHADRARRILEQGDVEEALSAASAIGDDRIQLEARGYVRPETFTHGSSAQRVRWFKSGLTSGRVADCDTFEAGAL